MEITEDVRPNQPMSGKVCLVTGATSGIGVVTAKELARRGATVVVGRSRERAEATVEQIRRATGDPAVESLLADLASQAEIRRLAREFREQHGRLDVLMNNAGASFSSRQESPDEIEMTPAVNHLFAFQGLPEGLIEVLPRDLAPLCIQPGTCHLSQAGEIHSLQIDRCVPDERV